MYFLRKTKKQTLEFMVLAFIGVAVVLGLIDANSSDEYDLIFKEEVNIEALKDNNSVEGQFVLGSGSIDGVTYYHYIEEIKKGVFKTKKAKIEDATISYLEDKKKPFVKIYIKRYKSKLVELLTSESYFYEFYVPEGSIDNEYKIDLE